MWGLNKVGSQMQPDAMKSQSSLGWWLRQIVVNLGFVLAGVASGMFAFSQGFGAIVWLFLLSFGASFVSGLVFRSVWPSVSFTVGFFIGVEYASKSWNMAHNVYHSYRSEVTFYLFMFVVGAFWAFVASIMKLAREGPDKNSHVRRGGTESMVDDK